MAIGPVNIGGRLVGPGLAPLIVAELSANHNGSLETALRIVDEAAAAGAGAVKLQTFTADTITLDSDDELFRIHGGPWDGYSLHKLYDEAHTPWAWHKPLFARARERGLLVFSSPFDPTAVDFLEQFEPPTYKIASFELVDLPLIRKAAATGKPLVMSTGMASFTEIGEAIAAAREAGGKDIVLLHCVSAYPAPAAEANLRMMGELSRRFSVPVGLSDHTIGTEVAVAATALGACMIEKHVTDSRANGGLDSHFSLEPAELRHLVQSCHTVFESLGRNDVETQSSESGSLYFRRSLFVVRDIRKGEVFTEQNVRSIRPGNGMPPKFLPAVLGRVAACDIARGTPLTADVVTGLGGPQR